MEEIEISGTPSVEPEPPPMVEEAPGDPAPEPPPVVEEIPSEPEPEQPPAVEEIPGELPADPETPPTEEIGDGSKTVKDLIDVIGDLNETITGAVGQEPGQLLEEGEGSGAGGNSGGGSEDLGPTVDFAPVSRVLERTNELLEQQQEILVTQHNDLLQLQANVNFVFLAVCVLIGVVLGVAVGKVFHNLWRA